MTGFSLLVERLLLLRALHTHTSIRHQAPPHLRRRQRHRPPEQSQKPQVDSAVDRAGVGRQARQKRVHAPVHDRLHRGAEVAQRKGARLGRVLLCRHDDGDVERHEAPKGGVL